LIEAETASKPLPQCTANVAVGSISDLCALNRNVRSAPDNRHE
jgi:hypothetical protein